MFKYQDILFRPVEEGDLENLRRLRNDSSTWVHLTDPNLISPSMQQFWFKRICESTDIKAFSVFENNLASPTIQEGDFLGFIRMDQIDSVNRSARIGCDIVPEKRGKGYGKKIYEALLKYFFDDCNFNRLWLCVLDTNLIARCLYMKIGFKEEGKYRQAVWRDGKWHDYIIMSILRDEYCEEKKR
jgi:RimJ/RimL family protein N-acetyltransferase